MKLNKLIPSIAMLAAGIVFSSSVLAEPGGMVPGRSADLNNMPDSSVELGFNFGEEDGVDYQYMGARYNQRVNPDLMGFVDIGQMEFSGDGGSVDEISFGIGGFYMMRDVLATADTAIKFSYHNVGGDIDGDFISLQGIVSGRNGLGSNPDLQWYGNLGFVRSSFRSESDTDFAIGFGIVHPTTSGEIYGGFEHIETMLFGVGYRHFL